MEPAHSIIRKLGGPSAVAALIGIHRTRVSNWQRPRSAGGTGGRVPQNHIPKLLQAAKAQGIDLRAEDFLPILTNDDVPELMDKPCEGAPDGSSEIADASSELADK